MIDTRIDKGLFEAWCKDCEHELSYAADGLRYCQHCGCIDGEAPTNYVKAESIKDSGERTQFFDKDGNAIGMRDMHEGKGRFDLLPLNAVWAVAKHCERGALKYGEHNVDKGIPVHSLFDSAIRHAFKWFLGWDDEPHLEAACWNLLWALEMMIVKPEMDDRPEVGFQARTDALLKGVDDGIH